MKKRNLSKKELEMFLLRDFISNETLGLRVKGIDESETPDFIVRELNKNISVELTRLIHPALMEKEAFQDKLVEMAQTLFKEKYAVDLYVLISFTNVPIKSKGKEIEKYAKELFKIIEEIYLPNKNFEFDIDTGYHRDVNQYIGHISVSNKRQMENWQPFGAYKVDHIDIKWIQSVVTKKESRLIEYPQKFDENWLLLVANFGHKSSTHDFFHIENRKVESKFDKIYLYKYMDKEITKLK